MGLLLIVVALVLVRDIVALSFRKVQAPARSTSYTARTSKKNIQEYAPIVRNNPFGAPGGELRQLSAADGESSANGLSGLTLVGTVSGPKKYSYAIFVDKNNDQEVFKIGDSVRSMGVLQKVEKDKVVLLAGGSAIEVPIIDAAPADSSAPQGGTLTAFPGTPVKAAILLTREKSSRRWNGPGR